MYIKEAYNSEVKECLFVFPVTCYISETQRISIKVGSCGILGVCGLNSSGAEENHKTPMTVGAPVQNRKKDVPFK